MSKSKRRPKRMEKHHRLPRSRGGSNDQRNLSEVEQEKHRAYHRLFNNMNAEEVAHHLSEVWIDPDYTLVAVLRYKLRPK